MPPKAYTISKLAKDAGVSTDIVRNYQMRGMLRPCDCAECGYSIYDESALSRLCFIRAGIVAGVGLSDLAGLCEALDEQKKERILQKLEAIEAVLNEKYKMLGSFMSQLDGIKLSTDGG